MLSIYGIILFITGKILYPRLLERGGIVGIKVLDGYTIHSLFFLMFILVYWEQTFWAPVIHGLIVSIVAWNQRNRVCARLKELTIFSSTLYLLLPYYTIVDHIEVHPLLVREIDVFPFVVW